MKSFKYFLALPMVITALASCGSSNETNFKETTYDNAVSITDNYMTSITNSKATSIAVSGHINKISVIGDATWWSAEAAGETKGMVGSLLSMIPNFSLKNSEIHIDSQDIASLSLPGALTSAAKNLLQNNSNTKTVFLSNLPKFPMNAHLLKLLRGFKSLPYDEKEKKVDWDKIEYEAWEKGKVNFYTGDGRLKIEISTEDLVGFVSEINKRINPETKEPEPEEKKYPGYVSVTTSKIGYIDSFSTKFRVEGIDEEFGKDTEIFYAHLKGDAEIDLSLNFKQKISDPITIKYQLLYYKEVEPVKAEFVYNYRSEDPQNRDTLTPHYLKLDPEKTIGPTYKLSDFSEYVTFDWFSNLSLNPNASSAYAQYYVLASNYDDPIFEYNYWNTNEKNVAFIDEFYDVVAIPTYKKDGKGKFTEPKYSILGAYPRDTFGEIATTKSLCSTSVDGRVVSSDTGIPYNNAGKALEIASDGLQMLSFTGDTKYDLLADEIFINSNLLSSGDSEYIVNIAITDYLG